MLLLRVDFVPPVNLEPDEYEVGRRAVAELYDLASRLDVSVVVSVLGHDMMVKHAGSLRPGIRDLKAIVGAATYALEEWMKKLAEERSTGYVCEHCKVSSPKSEWGPGRITCPRCGRMANAADGTPRF